ncbi:hypothetical protein F3Y22_tig00111022pilonHSYRG00246 [Hibiscus syriacus]|uniref:Amidohydrolase-related domain-containing protein n=1 Tax=Hibiscus syriacus TaxID=106335 RepID=A0A6A2Z6Z0_HIBSY|nr:hypothetical protein F3Y22_tig00111022pilonHSYRG00246 [Hibiscus syriacus]
MNLIQESEMFCDAGVGYPESTCGFSSTSSSKLLIKGGTVVNAHNQDVADVYVEDGVIVAVRPNIKVDEDVTLLDATGKYVMPGSFLFYEYMIDFGILTVNTREASWKHALKIFKWIT